MAQFEGFTQEKDEVNVITLILGATLLWLVIVAVGFMVLQFAKPFSSSLQFTGAQKIADRELEISIPRNKREVVNPVTEVSVYSNKEVSIKDNNRFDLVFLGKNGGKYVYILEVSNLGVGDSELVIEFRDMAGNTSTQNIQITRKRFAFPLGIDSVVPIDGAAVILDGNLLSSKVNNSNRLMEDYIPDDLVNLNKDLGLFTFNNAELRAEAGQALKTMLDALAADTGKYVTIASGYRSFESQVKTYANWIKEVGQKQADKFSARPGHSQHQLGTGVDLTNEESGWELVNEFSDTRAGKWLKENAQKYGFKAPFSSDQSANGGFTVEPWHYVYVGAN